MYTTIVVRRDTEGVFFDEVRRLCDELLQPGNAASHAAYGTAGLYVSYDPGGIAIKYGSRILRLQEGFKVEDIVAVRIEHHRRGDGRRWNVLPVRYRQDARVRQPPLPGHPHGGEAPATPQDAVL